MARLRLPTVTLCAAASVNVAATLAALRACLEQIEFAECLFFTDAEPADVPAEVRLVRIPPIRSALGYSQFLLGDFEGHVRSDHCLIVQWDGFVLDARRWDPGFLAYDYIGAPWPQFGDGRDVGNGGFSLRTKRLLIACRDPRFRFTHPEDVAICRLNRALLEGEHGIRFAERPVAERFAFERDKPPAATLGFHGIFNMIPSLGIDRFWEIYRSLDDRSSAYADYALLMRQLGRRSSGRRARLTSDRLKAALRR
jgi:hypothetical protein